MSVAPYKPHALIPDPDGVPDVLKELPQWVNWRYEPNDDRDDWTKVPLQAKAALREKPRNTSSTNPQTWASFETAWRAYAHNPPAAGNIPIPDDLEKDPGHGGLDGIGLCLVPDNGLVGIDLDKCLTDGVLTDPDAVEALELLAGTYVEVSPSGTGLRVFCRGRKPAGRCKTGTREMYDGRGKDGKPGGRYLTLTGHAFGKPQPVADKQEAVDALYAHWFAKPDKPTPKATATRSREPETLDDAALLERMFASKNGAAVRALWEGEGSAHKSESEADLALASHIAWWCDYDPARTDALFRESGLMQPKWDESRGELTYGQRTLETAFSGKGPGDGYQPRAGEKSSLDAEDGTETAGDYADKGNVIYRRKTKMAKRKGKWEEEVEDVALCNFSAESRR